LEARVTEAVNFMNLTMMTMIMTNPLISPSIHSHQIQFKLDLDDPAPGTTTFFPDFSFLSSFMGVECTQRNRYHSNANLWRQSLEKMNSESKMIIQLASESQKVEKGELARTEAKDWCMAQLRPQPLISKETLMLLWPKYDADRDNRITAAELAELLRECWANMQREAKTILSEVVVSQFRGLGLNEKELVQYLHNPEVAERITELCEETNRLFEFWLLQVEDLGQKMFRKMDADHSGFVSHEEFLTRFPEVSEEFCNSGQLKDALVRINASQYFVQPSAVASLQAA